MNPLLIQYAKTIVQLSFLLRILLKTVGDMYWWSDKYNGCNSRSNNTTDICNSIIGSGTK